MSTSLTLIEKLAREELVDMVPYQSARRLFASGDAEQTNRITYSMLIVVTVILSALKF